MEICSSVQAVKYLYKYIYKGSDHALAQLEPVAPGTEIVIDEIKDFCDSRYISCIEAVWHIFHNSMHGQYPNVVLMDIHLEDQNTVTFDDKQSIADILEKGSRDTKLTAWFKLNQIDKDAHKIKYLDLAKYYVWKSQPRQWTKRKGNPVHSISRMHMINPSDIERYAMRILLLHVYGVTSFEGIRTVDGIIYSTYQEAAIAMGLMQDDSEWDNCLKEVSLIETDCQYIMEIFISILCFSAPSSPKKLWLNHRNSICNKILYEKKKRLDDQSLTFSDDEYNEGLYQIEMKLNTNGKSLKNFPNMSQLPNSKN